MLLHYIEMLQELLGVCGKCAHRNTYYEYIITGLLGQVRYRDYADSPARYRY